MFHDGAYWVGMHWFWWLFWVVLIGAIFAWSAPMLRDRPKRESPHELLRRRLAAGEITPDEYERRKALLDRDAGSSAG